MHSRQISCLSVLLCLLCATALTVFFSTGKSHAADLQPPSYSGISSTSVAVTTDAVGSTTASSAASGGSISGNDVETYGICWSTTEEPTIKDSRTITKGNTDTFTSVAGPLEAETTYYIRAYAAIGEVAYYGEQVSVTTSAQTDTRSLIIHNPSSGAVLWWKTNSDNKLVSTKQDTGWGMVSDDTSYTGGWRIVGTLDFTYTHLLFWHDQESGGKVHWWRVNKESNKVASSGNGQGVISENWELGPDWELGGTCKLVDNALIWHDRASGKVVWWKILSDGLLLSEKQGQGWGYVNEEKSMPANWRLVAVLDREDQHVLFWQNQTDGTVAWWKINDSGSILDNTRDSGWGIVSEDVRVASDWTLVGAVEDSELPVLIWQNQSNGKVVWWLLNDDNKLADATQGSGWGFVSDTVTVSSAWQLCKVLQQDAYNILFWQNQDSGKLVWWKLNSSWQLKSDEREEGWGFVSDNTNAEGYILSEVFE